MKPNSVISQVIDPDVKKVRATDDVPNSMKEEGVRMMMMDANQRRLEAVNNALRASHLHAGVSAGCTGGRRGLWTVQLSQI